MQRNPRQRTVSNRGLFAKPAAPIQATNTRIDGGDLPTFGKVTGKENMLIATD